MGLFRYLFIVVFLFLGEYIVRKAPTPDNIFWWSGFILILCTDTICYYIKKIKE